MEKGANEILLNRENSLFKGTIGENDPRIIAREVEHCQDAQREHEVVSSTSQRRNKTAIVERANHLISRMLQLVSIRKQQYVQGYLIIQVVSM